MSTSQQTPSIPPASSGPAGGVPDAAKEEQKKSKLAPDITRESDSDARNLFDQVEASLLRLNNRLQYNSGELGLSDQQIGQLHRNVNRLQEEINNPNTDKEVRKGLAKKLESLSNSPLLLGPGGKGNQFAKAVMKGLSTHDPLLGLIIALLAFLIKQQLKERKLKQLQEEIEKLPQGNPLKAKKENELGTLRAELDEMATARKEFEKELYTAAQAKDSSVTRENISEWIDKFGEAPNKDAINNAVNEAEANSPLGQAMLKFETAGGMMARNSPNSSGAAASAASAGNTVLKQKLETIRTGTSPTPTAESSAASSARP